MKSILMILFFILAFLFSWLAEAKLKKKLFTKLLACEKKGDSKNYFKLLEEPVAKICLSASSRLLLQLDFYLTYGNVDKVEKLITKITKKPADLSKDQNLLIRLMRSYVLFLDKNNNQEALKLEDYLRKNCKKTQIQKEIEQLHQVYLAPSQNLLTELSKQLKTAEKPQQKLIIYDRLTKVSESLGLKKQAKEYLTQMRKIAQKTIKMEEF